MDANGGKERQKKAKGGKERQTQDNGGKWRLEEKNGGKRGREIKCGGSATDAHLIVFSFTEFRTNESDISSGAQQILTPFQEIFTPDQN